MSVSPSLDNVRFRLMVFLASVLSLLFITQAEIIAAGQVQKISVHTNGHEPLTSVFRTIEKSSIYLFNYQDKDVAGIKVSVSIDNATVEEVMASVLKGTELAWQIKGKNIIVSVSRQQASGSRREVTIRGKVIDSDGQPIPGVGVLERDGKNGTVTDIDGNYSLQTTKGVVLIYSCIGYKDCTAVVGTSDVINMTLNAEDVQLDEAVVTALGIRKSEKSLRILYPAGQCGGLLQGEDGQPSQHAEWKDRRSYSEHQSGNSRGSCCASSRRVTYICGERNSCQVL